MSKIEVKLCSLLLREYFGEVVQKTGTYLMEQLCSRPLLQIATSTSLPPRKVKCSLRVLILHNFCEFNLNQNRVVEYGININQVLLLMQYPRYMYCVKILYGDDAELLVEELLYTGRITMSQAIRNVVERLQEATGKDYTVCEIASIKSKFVKLVEARFFKRCPRPKRMKKNSPMPVMVLAENEEYLVPEVNIYLLGKDYHGEPPAKQQKFEREELPNKDDDCKPFAKKWKTENNNFSGVSSSSGTPLINMQKTEKEKFPDEGIYWRINSDRFHQYIRDEVVVRASSSIFGKKASEVFRTLLQISENYSNPWMCSTHPVAKYEILAVLMKKTNIDENELDSYLSIITDHPCNFLFKAEDRSGGMYSVNIYKTLQKIIEEFSISVVRDNYGSGCSRIFNLLLSKKHLAQKQIEEIAMISPREAKRLTYQMLNENFVIAKEIPRTQDHVPSRELYVLSVDIEQVCRTLLQRCYKQIANAIIRFQFINKENKRLLDKKQRNDCIIITLQQSGVELAQIEEVEQMITPPEQILLEKVKKYTEKLETSQIQLAEDALLLQIWLNHLAVKMQI